MAMQGARRRQWQALVKLRNVAVAHSGRSLRAGQKRPWTGVALVRIGDGQSFTRAPWPETFLIPLNQCELLTQDTRSGCARYFFIGGLNPLYDSLLTDCLALRELRWVG